MSRIVERYDEWRTYGIWAALLKQTNEFIGLVCTKATLSGEIEVGCHRLFIAQVPGKWVYGGKPLNSEAWI